MKISFTLGAMALLSLAACGGERGVEEPAVAEERVGEREGLAPVEGEGELGREGVVGGEAGEREGVRGLEANEREAAVGAEGIEREE